MANLVRIVAIPLSRLICSISFVFLRRKFGCLPSLIVRVHGSPIKYPHIKPARSGMKIDRHGRAKILTTQEIQLLFSQGFKDNPYPERDRALFGVCLYTGCRINEACTLKTKET